MSAYRFYLLDDADHFMGVVEKRVADDEEAKKFVKNLGKEVPIEVWSGVRKVGRFDTNNDP